MRSRAIKFGRGSHHRSLKDMLGSYFAAHYNMVGSQNFSITSSPIHSASAVAAFWDKHDTSVAASLVLGPDGVSVAQKLNANVNNTQHFMQLASSPGGGLEFDFKEVGIDWRLAFIVKAAEYSRIVLRNSCDFSFGSAGFDLAGGNAGYDISTSGPFTVLGQSITSLGLGWWLCILDIRHTAAEGASFQPQIYLDNGSGTAARSISFAGTGSTGVLLWWSSWLPKAAWSLGREVFRDDFNSLSTIDLGDTRAPGFNFYVHNAWPSFPDPSSTIRTGPATQSSDLSISNSLLSLPRKVTTWGSTLCSAAANPSDSSTYVGSAFQPPAFFESRSAWDLGPTFAGGAQSWPAFWSIAIENLTGSNVNLVENDFFEAPVGNFGGGGEFNMLSVLHHSDTIFPQVGHVTQNTQEGAGSLNTPFQVSDYHNYGCLVLPAGTAGPTNGLKMSFYDGVMMFTGIGVWSTTGAYSAMNTAHMPILFASGTTPVPADWPYKIDWVRVLKP